MAVLDAADVVVVWDLDAVIGDVEDAVVVVVVTIAVVSVVYAIVVVVEMLAVMISVMILVLLGFSFENLLTLVTESAAVME